MIAELAHTDRGDGDLPLVLVHGFTGSQLDWTDIIDELALERRVITLDHRGHGESPHFGDEDAYSLSILADDFAALVDRLGLERFDLLGHSNPRAAHLPHEEQTAAWLDVVREHLSDAAK